MSETADAGLPTADVERAATETAQAAQVLAGQTRNLVRRQIEAAQREVREKLQISAPAAGYLAGAALCGLFAGAASFRWSIRLLEHVLPPGAAALLATAGYGAAAGWLALTGIRLLQTAPAPLPIETVEQTGAAVAGATAAGRGDSAR